MSGVNGEPQCGQAAAASLTDFWHSGHLINDIVCISSALDGASRKLTRYDNATAGSGNVVSEIVSENNDLGNLSKEYLLARKELRSLSSPVNNQFTASCLNLSFFRHGY